MQALQFPQLINVNSYAKPVHGNGNQFLRMYQTQPAGLPNPWYFVHRDNAPIGGVGVFTIYEDKQGKQFVHLLKMKRPALGGRITLEPPAELIGDQAGSVDILDSAKREVREETGLDPVNVKLLLPHNLPIAQGYSDELNSYAMALVKGQPKGEDLRDEAEKAIIIGQMHVPVETFSNTERFTAWVKDMTAQNYLITSGVYTGKALMPTLVNGKVPFSGAKLNNLA